MNEADVTTESDLTTVQKSSRAVPIWQSEHFPVVVVVAALMLAFGFEVFSFNLTIDEELIGEYGNVSYAEMWVAQGRWAMAVVTLLTPSSVVPVVTTGLGVALSGLAFWWLCRHYFELGPWPSAMATSLAGTIPVLTFIFAFATIALGIGVSSVLVAVFAWGLSSVSWRRRAIGVLAGAAALGVYDSLLFGLAIVAIFFIFVQASVRAIALGITLPSISLGLSKVVSLGLGSVFDVPANGYVGNYIDIGGLISQPLNRMSQALHNYYATLTLSAEKFGLHSPWLGAVIVVLFVLALFGAWRLGSGAKVRVIRLLCAFLVLAIPFAAELVSNGPVLLRSMVYLPYLVLVLSAMAVVGVYKIPWAKVRRVLMGSVSVLAILAVIGNATISNRMFAAAATMYSLDQQLAFEISREKDLLTNDDHWVSLPLAVSGNHSWPYGTLTPVREALGASFFSWGGGDPERISAFLRSQGVQVHSASRDEAAAAREWFGDMPEYPQPGWIDVREGILLLNFGPPTVYQVARQ